MTKTEERGTDKTVYISLLMWIACISSIASILWTFDIRNIYYYDGCKLLSFLWFRLALWITAL